MPVTNEKNSAKAVAESLAQLLADTYVLGAKTQNYHWNVIGPEFYSLHKLFEEQYGELFAAVDEVAERIRAIGYPVQGTLATFASKSQIKESDEIPNAKQMLEKLAKAHVKAAEAARAVIEAAEAVGDDASADLATQRLQAHDKAAWMLKSSIA